METKRIAEISDPKGHLPKRDMTFAGLRTPASSSLPYAFQTMIPDIFDIIAETGNGWQFEILPIGNVPGEDRMDMNTGTSFPRPIHAIFDQTGPS